VFGWCRASFLFTGRGRMGPGVKDMWGHHKRLKMAEQVANSTTAFFLLMP
jgi:hypothetical protein